MSFILVDDTRVKLKDVDPNVPGSDYINANYIRWKADESLGSSEMQSDPSGKVYIATQGQCSILRKLERRLLLSMK